MMTLLRLTFANYGVIKRRSRHTYPSIQSSHLTEALAAEFGWKTHAALKAALEAAQLGREPVVRPEGQEFRHRLGELNHGGVEPKTFLAAVANSDLPDPCWKLIERSDRASQDSWFYYCRANNLPTIALQMARKYVTLEWDCISLDPYYEGPVRGEGARAILKQLFARFQMRAKYDKGGPMFDGSAFVGGVKNLDPLTARELADDFFEILYTATSARTSLETN